MVGATLAERVKELREARGWSQGQLAEKAGFDSGYISLIEAGKRVPKLENRRKLADALGVAITELAPTGVEEVTNYHAELWQRFARHFKAGDAEAFAEVVANLPKSDQAMLVRLAKLLDIETKLG
jgi:transcriptional regulator with XRE-family HTH domain